MEGFLSNTVGRDDKRKNIDKSKGKIEINGNDNSVIIIDMGKIAKKCNISYEQLTPILTPIKDFIQGKFDEIKIELNNEVTSKIGQVFESKLEAFLLNQNNIVAPQFSKSEIFDTIFNIINENKTNQKIMLEKLCDEEKRLNIQIQKILFTLGKMQDQNNAKMAEILGAVESIKEIITQSSNAANEKTGALPSNGSREGIDDGNAIESKTTSSNRKDDTKYIDQITWYITSLKSEVQDIISGEKTCFATVIDIEFSTEISLELENIKRECLSCKESCDNNLSLKFQNKFQKLLDKITKDK